MTDTDVLGAPYTVETIDLGADSEGPVVATLVHRPSVSPTTRAVLHVHGFADYFFHTEYAEWWTSRGYDFYALDLRKYGRSIRSHQTPNYVGDLKEHFDEIEQKEGRKPGGRTRKRIKDELITDLMPRAFIKPSRTDALLDLEHGIAVIDSSSRKSAENVCSEVRRALGSFPALPLNAEIAPRSILTGWVAGEPLPDGLSIGDECELRDPVDQGAVVKVQRMDLHSDEIARHLETGKQVTRLALSLDDHVSFVLGDDLVVRKFKLLDGAVDELDNNNADDARAELDARFALMSAEVKRLFAVLESAMKLSKAD